MKITHSTTDTLKGPADWFTGDVYIDMIPGPSAPSRLNAAAVHSHPGARNRGPGTPTHSARRSL